jgi:HAE1 family hydrophobic/amphiphilic exporter-1
MISMFISFTLDPMLSSVWHDPTIHAHGEHGRSNTFYDRTIGPITAWFETTTDRLIALYQRILKWALVHKRATLGIAIGTFALSIFMVPLLGTEFVPKADFSETSLA